MKQYRLGPASETALRYIAEHPGVNTAEVNRARRTARGGHASMYQTIDRLMRARLVERTAPVSGRGVGLRITALGAERLEGGAA